MGNEGDWDALTACIGLIHELKYFNNDAYHFVYTKPTFRVFCRFVSSWPFFGIADELYRYLMANILDNPSGQEIIDGMSEIDIFTMASVSSSRILLIEDLELLKTHFVTPKSCLHIAERYLTATVIHEIFEHIRASRWREVYKMPEIKKLARSLQRWEAKHPRVDAH